MRLNNASCKRLQNFGSVLDEGQEFPNPHPYERRGKIMMPTNRRSPQVECVLDARALLGESPVWRPKGNALYWIDRKRPAIRRFQPGSGSYQTWPIEEEIGSMGLRQSGGAEAAFAPSSNEAPFHRP